MNTIILKPGFKALGKMYQLLACENHYFKGGYKSQKEWLDYDKTISKIKKSISALEQKLLF